MTVERAAAAPGSVTRDAAERARGLAETLAARLDRDGWAGVDPYDGLASPVARLLPHRRARQALIQAVKRFPLDLRPVLGIGPRRMAMTTGLGASAAARLADEHLWRERRDRLAHWTAAARTPTGLWGYEFDVQTRWAFYPAGSANIVATAFAADGCLDAGVLDGEDTTRLGRALLEQHARDGWFAYTPESDRLIHNANLLGAALATRLAGARPPGDPLRAELEAAAGRALATTLDAQRPDGSWPYGEGQGLGWVDGFHTAYVLLRADQTAAGLGVDASKELDRGAECYFGRMVTGGRPHYLLDGGPGRADVNNTATALRAAVWGAATGRARETLPAAVLDHLVAAHWDPAGGLRVGTTGARARLRWPRWGCAPALDALTALVAWTAPPAGPTPG